MPTERDGHPNASHKRFPYFFANAGEEDHNKIHGIDFDGIIYPEFSNLSPKWINDLIIFYGPTLSDYYLDVMCSRWDVQDYSHIVQTWIKKADVQNLMDNIRPGAVGELYNILGKPKYYDKTWTGSNTIRLLPAPSSQQMNDSTLKYMRPETLIYVKNVTEHPIEGKSGWIEIKLEGYASSNSL
jgi:hypothetical protein